MRNVTVSMDDKVARWVRIEAARHDMSVSRFLAELARKHMVSEQRYQKALRSALARKPFLKTGGRYPSREELHERTRLR
jgi:hypothetical protein